MAGQGADWGRAQIVFVGLLLAATVLFVVGVSLGAGQRTFRRRRRPPSSRAAGEGTAVHQLASAFEHPEAPVARDLVAAAA